MLFLIIQQGDVGMDSGEIQGNVVCPYCEYKQHAADAYRDGIETLANFACVACGQPFTEEDTYWKGRE